MCTPLLARVGSHWCCQRWQREKIGLVEKKGSYETVGVEDLPRESIFRESHLLVTSSQAEMPCETKATSMPQDDGGTCKYTMTTYLIVSIKHYSVLSKYTQEEDAGSPSDKESSDEVAVTSAVLPIISRYSKTASQVSASSIPL